MLVGDFLSYINRHIPPYLVEDFDNVGLQIGDPGNSVEKIAITVDVTGELVSKCVKDGFGLIISHHPLIFKPLKNIDFSDPVNAIIKEIILNNISLIAVHTNLDAIDWGVSDALCDLLKLRERSPVRRAESSDYKLVTFVPFDSLDKVRDAVCEAGAGRIGDYSYCSFSSPGVGSFLGGETTKPAVGVPGKLEKVDEYRLEVVAKKADLGNVVKAIKKSHPYEEAAYDIYKLSNPSSYGIGRIGTLKNGLKVKDVAGILGKEKAVNNLSITGDPDRIVSRIAVCGGSASSVVKKSAALGAGLLIGGEFGYHSKLEASQNNMALIEMGHGVSESFVLKPLKSKLEMFTGERKEEIEIMTYFYDMKQFSYEYD